MVDIAIAYSKFSTSRSGGARESLLRLMCGAAEKMNPVVDVFQTTPTDDPPDANFEYHSYTKRIYEVPKLSWTNQVTTRLQWSRYFRKTLEPRYDMLITQNALAPASVQVANELNIPSLFFVHSMVLTGHEKYDPDCSHLLNLFGTDIGGRVQYPFLWRNFHDYRRAAATATHTIANSKFTAKKIEDLFGVKSNIIYPPIKLENYQVEYNPDGYITMVNPRAEYKGADIFLDIAEESPDEGFLLVGPTSSDTIEKRAGNLSNVNHWEWCEDMREVYGESKLVVVPSRVKESFGRVPAEAMVSGIPCVVSDRGGLPEVVGDTGEVVKDIDSIDQWLGSIRNAFETHEPEAQKCRVKKFSAEKQVEKFSELIEDIETPEVN